MLTAWEYTSTQSKQISLQTTARLCVNALLGGRLWDEEGVEIIGHHFILVVQFCNAFSHAALAAAGTTFSLRHVSQSLKRVAARKVKRSSHYM